MAGQASVFTNRKGALYWLLGLTFFFQLVSHLKMWSVLRAEEEERLADVDAWCPASANFSAPRCAEARLFRAWREAAAVAAGGRGPVAAAGVGLVDRAEVEDMTTTAAPGVFEASTTPAAPAPAPWSPMTAWAEGLSELQRGLERRLNALPSMTRRRSEEFERHAGRIAVSLESSQLTHWGEDLRVLQEQLEAKQAALHPNRTVSEPHAVGSAAEPGEDVHTLAESAGAAEQSTTKEHSTAIAAEPSATFEPSLMEQINAVHKELCQDPRRRERADCKEFLAGLAAAREAARDVKHLATKTARAAGAKVESELRADLDRIAAEHAAWQADFEAQLRASYRELCAQRGGAWCNAPEAAAPKPEEKAARRAAIAREAKDRSAALDAKLAKLAADRKDWERELLDHYGVPTSEAGPAVDAAGAPPSSASAAWPSPRRGLRWSKVAAWAAAGKRLRGGAAGAGAAAGGHAEATRADLKGLRWAEGLPRVACVTAVPLGHRAKSQVKHVVEHFQQQTYEGPSMLVLVYHHEDREAARVVKEYSQPPYIHGVAAQGSKKDFPSAPALRFGAWSAKGADAVAQWDFDARQHPRRLQWQIDAMALARKPGSLLRPKAEMGDRPEALEGSLVGEISWMREYWHPGMQEQHAAIEGPQASNVVAVALDAKRPHTTTAASERLRAIRADMDKHFERLAELLGEGHAANGTAAAPAAAAPSPTPSAP